MKNIIISLAICVLMLGSNVSIASSSESSSDGSSSSDGESAFTSRNTKKVKKGKSKRESRRSPGHKKTRSGTQMNSQYFLGGSNDVFKYEAQRPTYRGRHDYENPSSEDEESDDSTLDSGDEKTTAKKKEMRRILDLNVEQHTNNVKGKLAEDYNDYRNSSRKDKIETPMHTLIEYSCESIGWYLGYTFGKMVPCGSVIKYFTGAFGVCLGRYLSSPFTYTYNWGASYFFNKVKPNHLVLGDDVLNELEDDVISNEAASEETRLGLSPTPSAVSSSTKTCLNPVVPSLASTNASVITASSLA